eukprot:scaffold269378_cov30-Tisochrysis_lutea.AAC.3
MLPRVKRPERVSQRDCTIAPETPILFRTSSEVLNSLGSPPRRAVALPVALRRYVRHPKDELVENVVIAVPVGVHDDACRLQERDEFLLRFVSAFPKASRRGLVITSNAPSSMDDFDEPASWRCLVTNARCRSTNLHVSVLPAPEGPETTIAYEGHARTVA